MGNTMLTAAEQRPLTQVSKPLSKTFSNARKTGILTNQQLPLRTPSAKAWGALDDEGRENVAAMAIDNPLGIIEVVDELAAVQMAHAGDIDKLRAAVQVLREQVAQISKRVSK